MKFCILSHWHWFLVIIKNSDTDCSKGISEEISEEYNSINLHIRTVCAAPKGNTLKTCEFVNIHNTEQSFEFLGVGSKKESVQQTQREYKNKIERKEQYSH